MAEGRGGSQNTQRQPEPEPEGEHLFHGTPPPQEVAPPDDAPEAAAPRQRGRPKKSKKDKQAAQNDGNPPSYVNEERRTKARFHTVLGKPPSNDCLFVLVPTPKKRINARFQSVVGKLPSSDCLIILVPTPKRRIKARFHGALGNPPSSDCMLVLVPTPKTRIKARFYGALGNPPSSDCMLVLVPTPEKKTKCWKETKEATPKTNPRRPTKLWRVMVDKSGPSELITPTAETWTYELPQRSTGHAEGCRRMTYDTGSSSSLRKRLTPNTKGEGTRGIARGERTLEKPHRRTAPRRPTSRRSL
ncbi:hypothetical protein M569_02570 [Genlisea aurea]|uniref:Uncharacterized protein n=1 Tax=Genlisea aurea TaxID=192259 RepID=S8CYX8_9LAMI|nr:hypothetical protein M569_02570 [Genlisea aurea]